MIKVSIRMKPFRPPDSHWDTNKLDSQKNKKPFFKLVQHINSRKTCG